MAVLVLMELQLLRTAIVALWRGYSGVLLSPPTLLSKLFIVWLCGNENSNVPVGGGGCAEESPPDNVSKVTDFEDDFKGQEKLGAGDPLPGTGSDMLIFSSKSNRSNRIFEIINAFFVPEQSPSKVSGDSDSLRKLCTLPELIVLAMAPGRRDSIASSRGDFTAAGIPGLDVGGLGRSETRAAKESRIASISGVTYTTLPS